MKIISTVFLLLFLPLASLPCTCLSILPINLTAQQTPYLFIGEISSTTTFSNSLELTITQVLKGDSKLQGMKVRVWGDLYCDGVYYPADFTGPVLLAVKSINPDNMGFYVQGSDDFKRLASQSNYDDLLKLANAKPNFVTPACTNALVPLRPRNTVEWGKLKGDKLVIRKRKMNSTALIEQLMANL